MKVYLGGGDKSGWALAQEQMQAERLYRTIEECELVETVEACDIIHSVWWYPLLKLPLSILQEKFLICSMSNRPFFEFTEPQFSMLLPYINKIITQSTQAKKEFESIGIKTFYLPYTIDSETFKPFSKDKIIALKQKFNIPLNKYIIGNFHRDSDGQNLDIPKHQKGADVLFEIIKNVWKETQNVHVLLAGPRRHWLRSQLERSSIPYTFIGKFTEDDDWKINILDQTAINELYQLLDLAIVSSRWEGAPRTIMEAAATRTKIISTRVGIAEDLLCGECLFDNFIEAAEIILNDLQHNILESTIDKHSQTLHRNHTVSAVTPVFKAFYEEASTFAATRDKQCERNAVYFMSNGDQRTDARITVGLWHTFHKPPYGGGNQFMMALAKQLQQKGIKFINNTIRRTIDCYLVNSIWFDIKSFLTKSKHQKMPVVQRIDGPIQVYRVDDKELDDLIQQINTELACFSILQSNYVLTRNAELGYTFVNPVIIRNAVDSDIFNRSGRIVFSRDRKIKLISTSWSDNPRKGGAVYKWLDEHLDWDRYEYTFVGRTKEHFHHIQHHAPVPSEELAALLKQHDIYIFAGQYDCCSNAVLEALACGLPTIYHASGGSLELVGTGGLGFLEPEQIPRLLETLVVYYESFQNLISIQGLEEIAEKYLEVMRLAAGTQRSSRLRQMRDVFTQLYHKLFGKPWYP